MTLRGNPTTAGFMLAPLLYMLALAGIGAAVMFSGYSQILRSNAEMTAINAARSQLQSAGQTLSASSVLDTATSSIVQPPSVYAFTTVASGADAPRLPTNYANAGNTGSPHDVGVVDVSTGVRQLDPWGKYYVYCRWENAVSSPSLPSIMVISAGPNGTLETKCGDTTAQGDDRIITSTVAETINRANVWQVSSSSQVKFGLDTNAVRVNQDGSLTASSITITEPVAGNATLITAKDKSGTTVFTVSNTGLVSAASYSASSGTFNTITVSGAAGLGSATIGGAATVGTTLGVTGAATLGSLGVTGATTLTGALAANGGTTTTTLSTSGLATLNSLSAGASGLGNTQVTGTLGATGNFNVATNKFTVDASSGNTAIAGTLSAGAASLSSLTLGTPLALTYGGTGAADAAGARTNLGLGTMATQNASAVAITGGTISGVTITGGSVSGGSVSGDIAGHAALDLAIANNLSDVNNAATARANIGANNASNLITGTLSTGVFPLSGVTAGGPFNSFTVDAYGRVTSATSTTASQWTTTGSDIYFSSGNVGIGTNAPSQRLDVNGDEIIRGAAGTSRNLFFGTGTSKRWSINANATAEGGSNAGSDLVINTYKDDGTALGTALTITRANGNAAFGGTVTAPNFVGNLTGNVTGGVSGSISLSDGDAGNPGLYFTNDTNTGIFRPGADVFGITAGGKDVARFTGNTSNVNYFNFSASNGGPVSVAALGTDTNIGIDLLPKGTGNVGIGTTSPGQKLDILGYGLEIGADWATGAARTDATMKGGYLAVPHYTNAQPPMGLIMGMSGSSTNLVYIGGGTSNVNAATIITFLTAANNTTVGGTERMRITSNGNVGIGTTTPGTILGFGGDAARTVGMERGTVAATAGYGLTLQAGGATLGATDKSGGTLTLSGGTATGTGSSSIVFQTAPAQASTNTTDNAPTTKMTILGNGNVGIGTSSPSQVLNVAGNILAQLSSGGGIVLQSASGASDKNAIYWQNSNGVEKWRIVNDQSATLTDDLRFYSNATGTNVMSLVQGGNVGIGTTSPATNLDVHGDLQVGNDGGSSGSGTITIHSHIDPQYNALITKSGVNGLAIQSVGQDSSATRSWIELETSAYLDFKTAAILGCGLKRTNRSARR